MAGGRDGGRARASGGTRAWGDANGGGGGGGARARDGGSPGPGAIGSTWKSFLKLG